MKTDEAIAECRRWFAYLKRDEEKTRRLQEAASLARAGKREESQRIIRQIDRKPTVYDGANLRHAVAHLVSVVEGGRYGAGRSNCEECSATAHDHDGGGHFMECSHYAGIEGER